MAFEQDNTAAQPTSQPPSSRPVDSTKKQPPKYPDNRRPNREAGSAHPQAVAAEAVAEGGFFAIYKKGQGYWTRLGTALGALLIGVLMAGFIYEQLPVLASGITRVQTIAVTGAFLGVYCLVIFWITNKPRNVDFLIATDSEMKKVNWTSRKELIGSTKVVIIFMVLVASILFIIDIVFGYFFKLIKVLEAGPFG